MLQRLMGCMAPGVSTGLGLLLAACRDQDAVTLTQLLHEGIQPVNERDTDGWTPLHWCASNGDAKCMALLLAHKAKTDVADKVGRRPLAVAARNGCLECIQLLVAAGANLHAADREGLSALHHAARFSHLEVLRLLLRHGARVNQTDKDSWTALHFAAQNNLCEVADILLEHGAALNATDKHGLVDVSELLIRAGADVDAESNCGYTALVWAAASERTECVSLLLSAGAKLEPVIQRMGALSEFHERRAKQIRAFVEGVLLGQKAAPDKSVQGTIHIVAHNTPAVDTPVDTKA